MSLKLRALAKAALCSTAITGIAIYAPAANAQAPVSFRIAPQPLASALREFGLQSGMTIFADEALTRGRTSAGFTASADPEIALAALLRGSGLGYQHRGSVFTVARAGPVSPVSSASAAPTTSSNDIIVTAQKREQRIQDVPIAITALSSKALDTLKIEGGSELLRAVPNVTFSKNNFSGFNFSIRGIGTKAVSITTDPAVAISYNNVPLIRNRLFEQEYFDVDRVEVLRGPQGTLYGRNATGGVVNMITNKPSFKEFDGELRGEVGNYSTRRLRGFVNLPVTDTIALRVAGAATRRDGFDYNTITRERVNGRNLWQTRVSAKWRPDEKTNFDFVWEHFSENDDRSRTGKQLCDRDPGPSSVNGVAIADPEISAHLSQGCRATSLFKASAYGTPNGLSLPLVQAGSQLAFIGIDPNTGGQATLFTPGIDPYGGQMQSRNLREIASVYNPKFKAKNDVFELNIDRDIGNGLKLFSQTSWSTDSYYSTQDYNRFNTVPVFNSSSGLTDVIGQPLPGGGLTPGGYYNDPQLGPSNRLIGVDVDDSKSNQFYQEFRLQSSWQGKFNFSLGVNYLRYKTLEDYFVLFNAVSALDQALFIKTDPVTNVDSPVGPGDIGAFPYIDPNPVNRLGKDGHNYFRSKNPYIVNSGAAYGELYYEVQPNLRVTGGVRFTLDRKSAVPVPSQLLLGDSTANPDGGAANGIYGGFASRGYPAGPTIKQTFRALTGRVVVDWKPVVAFTDKTLIYTSYSRGYKGGGVNPPGIGANPAYLQYQAQPNQFAPEFVNALEIGTKNTLLNNALTLNLTAFGYAYHGYQISKIIDRTSINENINAKIWGAELESIYQPTRNLAFNVNLGYLGTRIDGGSRSIDVADRTQGDPDYAVVKPFYQLSSNCIAPTKAIAAILNAHSADMDQAALQENYRSTAISALCGATYLGDFDPTRLNRPFVHFDEIYGFAYNPATDAPNGGQGIYANLKGNQLPNSPHFTANIGVTYTVPVGQWGVVLHGDYYRQSSSYARIYNDTFDKLKGWGNFNLSLSVGQEDQNLVFQFYVKNVLNDTPITDAFVNSDDSGLTTNVFTLDPRIFGFNITKKF